MLSKQKIATEAMMIADCSDEVDSLFFDGKYSEAAQKAAELGATWASEQYAGLVKAAEYMLRNSGWYSEKTGGEKEAIDNLYEELDKLKQP